MSLQGIDDIFYSGCGYPLRHVEWDGVDWTFAPLRLAGALNDGEGGFRDDEAYEIDAGCSTTSTLTSGASRTQSLSTGS